jgi:hypothetical protein
MVTHKRNRRGSVAAAALVFVAIAALLALSSRMRLSTLSQEVGRLQDDLQSRHAAESALELAHHLAEQGPLPESQELAVGAARATLTSGRVTQTESVTDTPLRIEVKAGRNRLSLIAHAVRSPVTRPPVRVERVREVASHLSHCADWATLAAWEQSEEKREAAALAAR